MRLLAALCVGCLSVSAIAAPIIEYLDGTYAYAYVENGVLHEGSGELPEAGPTVGNTPEDPGATLVLPSWFDWRVAFINTKSSPDTYSPSIQGKTAVTESVVGTLIGRFSIDSDAPLAELDFWVDVSPGADYRAQLYREGQPEPLWSAPDDVIGFELIEQQIPLTAGIYRIELVAPDTSAFALSLSTIPEPASLALMGSGLLYLCAAGHRGQHGR